MANIGWRYFVIFACLTVVSTAVIYFCGCLLIKSGWQTAYASQSTLRQSRKASRSSLSTLGRRL